MRERWCSLVTLEGGWFGYIVALPSCSRVFKAAETSKQRTRRGIPAWLLSKHRLDQSVPCLFPLLQIPYKASHVLEDPSS